MFDRGTLLFSSVCGLKVFSSVVCSAKERSSAMLQKYIGLYTRLTCVHVEPAHQTHSTAPPLPCESHPAQRFSITLVKEEDRRFLERTRASFGDDRVLENLGI